MNLQNPTTVTTNLLSQLTSQVTANAYRAIDGTVYHNTTSKPIWITLSIDVKSLTGLVTVYSDATNTPSTVIATEQNNTAVIIRMVTTVPILPGNYFSVSVTNSDLVYWIETT